MQDNIIELISEYPEEFKKSMRRQYLLGYYRKAFIKQYHRSKKYISDTVVKTLYYMEMRDKAIEQGNIDAMLFCVNRIKELVSILVKFQNANYYRRRNMGGDITNDMIRRAKDFPFENLLEFRHNVTKCPFHEDKHPSMSLKNNKVHCFVCNKTWNTIDFVMEKDGLTFHRTVKKLC